jgi:hypothetical protein
MAGLGGQVASRRSTKRRDGTTQVNVTLKVPMPRFGDLVNAIKALGRVDGENVQGFNPAAITGDPGAKDVLAEVSLALSEPSSQKPGGVANIEVKTLEAAATAIGNLIKQVGGTLVSRQEQRRSGTATATYRIRAPRARFAELVAAINNPELIGRLVNKQLVGVDVVDVEGPMAKVPCELTLTLYELARQTPSASATVAARSLDSAAKAIGELLRSVDGLVVSHTENRNPEGTSTANYVLRCRRAKFPVMIDGLAAIGTRVENKRVQGLDMEPVEGAAADVLCDLTLQVYERRAPVPAADVEIQVDESEEASAALAAARDRFKAETVDVNKTRNADGSSQEVWRLRVKVKDFEAFVSDAEEIGEVKRRQIHGVGSGSDERPDPEALANVAVTLRQLKPVKVAERGTFRGALSAALKTLGYILAAMIYGLIVLVPVALAFAFVLKMVVRIVRGRPAPVAAAEPKNE